MYEIDFCANKEGIVGLSFPLTDVLQQGEYRTFEKAKDALVSYLSETCQVPNDQIEITESPLSHAMDSQN